MRILDLFCKAGGAAKGYADAGFEVVGVDIEPQPNYPFEFVGGDVLDLMNNLEWMNKKWAFSAVHASPPCQGYSTQTPDRTRHQRLVDQVRDILIATGLPYVIENVEGARSEMRDPARLCGSSFGLDVRRHRYFETNWLLLTPPCNHGWQTPRFRSLDMSMVKAGRLASVVGVHGHINYAGESEIRKRAMGIDWMTDAELAEAIPPAYTEFIGLQLLAHIESERVA